MGKENSQGNTPPPSSTLRVLKWFCPAHLYEEIEGDLIQKFNRDQTAWSRGCQSKIALEYNSFSPSRNFVKK